MRKPLRPSGRARPPPSPATPTKGRHNMSPSAAAAAAAAFFPSAAAARWLVRLLFLAAVAFPSAVLFRSSLLWIAPYGWGSDRVRAGEDAAPDVVLPFVADRLESEDIRLDRVLKEAAMEDKTVILTTLNAAWASPGSVIDLFLESFRIGIGTRKLLDHLVIVGLDHEAYMRCMSIHRHCFALVTEGVDFSGQKDFMSTGYLLMMWRRIDFLRLILEKGYNFIFSDVDIMWFRNPLLQFYTDGDFQIACDHFWGDPTDLSNRPNGGFNYVRTNNRSIEFYKFWHSSREKYPGYHDQDVLNFIKNDPFIVEIGVRIRFLSTEYFGGICEPSRDFNKVCTMHANCCIGLQRKLNDLRVMLDDWRNYMSLPLSIKISGMHTWSVPQNCSLAPLSPVDIVDKID